MLGLDPSLAKAGFVVLDLDAPDNVTVERGLLKTSNTDGILIQRLLKQQDQIRDMILKHDISFVGMEAPYFGGNSAEVLFALNQFIHKVFLDTGMYVVAFPPQTLKKLVFPDCSVCNIHKPHMINKAKEWLDLQGKTLAEDTADAYWAGYFGKRFYKWHIEKSLPEADLGNYEKEVFCGKHTFTRGPRAGYTEYRGIIYRENEFFFDFKAIKRRAEDAEQCRREKARQKKSGKKSGKKKSCKKSSDSG